MKKTFLAAAAAVVISVSAAAAASKLLFVPQNWEMNSSEPDVAAAENNVETGYYISVYEGVLAVYRETDRETPFILFEDVYIHSLPEYDRRQLEDGVYARDYGALSAMIEDYIS